MKARSDLVCVWRVRLIRWAFLNMNVGGGMVAPGTKTVDSPFHYFLHRLYYYSPFSIDPIDSIFEYFEEIHPWLEDTSRVKGPRG